MPHISSLYLHSLCSSAVSSVVHSVRIWMVPRHILHRMEMDQITLASGPGAVPPFRPAPADQRGFTERRRGPIRCGGDPARRPKRDDPRHQRGGLGGPVPAPRPLRTPAPVPRRVPPPPAPVLPGPSPGLWASGTAARHRRRPRT